MPPIHLGLGAFVIAAIVMAGVVLVCRRSTAPEIPIPFTFERPGIVAIGLVIAGATGLALAPAMSDCTPEPIAPPPSLDPAAIKPSYTVLCRIDTTPGDPFALAGGVTLAIGLVLGAARGVHHRDRSSAA